MSISLYNRVANAVKWSSMAELASKLIMPISTIVLARLLTPEDFGILVTATMVITFAEIFTDAGFHKFLIQHQFSSEDEKSRFSTVAFWSNLSISLLIWGGICLFSKEIACLVGCPGKENVIRISCVCIPIAAFSSIHTALLKKNLDFKVLFLVRIVGIMIPLFVTIPLAIVTRSYWALIVGMIALNLATAIVLSIKSFWKPVFYFEKKCLKDMLSFSIWSMLESICVWFTNYIDIFIVGSILNQHFLGVYRTSMSTVGQITALITAATTPVLYSALSQLQKDDNEFRKLFFRFQKMVGLLVIPLGFGIYIFRSLIVELLLGTQWGEAVYFVGLWGLTSSITIVLAHYSSEVYRSKGKPIISVFVQILHIAALFPVVIYFVHDSFDVLCTARSLVRLELIIVNLFFMYYVVRVSPLKMVGNVFPSIVCSIVMFVVVGFLPESTNVLQTFFYVFVAVLVYVFSICSFPNERRILVQFVKGYIYRRKK